VDTNQLLHPGDFPSPDDSSPLEIATTEEKAMYDQDTPDDLEELDAEDLEAVQEVLPGEDLSENLEDTILLHQYSLANKSIEETRTGLDDLLVSLSLLTYPAAFLDSRLDFKFQNEYFHRLLGTFHYQKRASFINTFGASMGQIEAKRFLKEANDPTQGFTWRGVLQHHTKTASGVITRALLIPYRPWGTQHTLPLGWILILDDITQENRHQIRGLFSSLLQASKLKDNDTGMHIERVNLYAELLASNMYGSHHWPEIDIDFVDQIGFLAAMHDVGKIGTPDDILNKKGPLNDFEWSIMKEHTINGSFILSSYPNPMAQQIAQSHHEHWDGSGYPYNLEGNMIPLSARIVAVADVYDALRMRCSYKEPCTHAKTSSLIIADGGRHFDPGIIEIYQEIHLRFQQIFDTNQD